MFYLILTIVIVALALYMKPNQTKGTGIWGGRGFKAIFKFMHSVHLDSKAQMVVNPNQVQETVDTLNEMVLDTTKLELEAQKRKMVSHMLLKHTVLEAQVAEGIEGAQAKLNELVETNAYKTYVKSTTKTATKKAS